MVAVLDPALEPDRIAVELKAIADKIAALRDEIRRLRPEALTREQVPAAGAELEAIVRDTEAATNRIMAAAESLLAADLNDPATARAEVEKHAIDIFEACGFQDITGQRISKVVKVLGEIEERTGGLAAALGVVEFDAPEIVRGGDPLLNGPAINGPETSQDDVDALFASAPAKPVSQADIDDLFA
jgi:chemotaxis regulatin CheY-phosphate phosphatase CheZ